MSTQLTITVDGFQEKALAGASVASLIVTHQAQHKDLVVELNGRFLPPSDYESTQLNEGDRVELIHPAFGG